MFFYYEDLAAAEAFYRDKLGLRLAADYGTAKILLAPAERADVIVDFTRVPVGQARP